MPGWMKHKGESRLSGEISITRYADDTTTLMAEGEEELKSFLIKMKEESEKASFKLNIQKSDGIWSHHFMANRWGNNGNSDRLLFSWAPKITADGDCSQEIRRHLLLGRKGMTALDSILKSRDITLPTKICIVRAVVFPVVMYECESWIIKKAECQRINAFQIMVLKKTLESPLDCKEIKPVNPKGNQP